jgi:hypothetical protein
VAILRSRLLSEVCEKHQIQPTLFYQRQRTFSENGAAAFAPKRLTSQALSKEQRKIAGPGSQAAPQDRGPGRDRPRNSCAQKKSLGRDEGPLSRLTTPATWSSTSSTAWPPAPTLARCGSAAGWNSPLPKYYDWRDRFGKANEHNALVPRDHWLEAAEKQAIIDFHARFPLEGYRRLPFMMLDEDVVAVSPSSVCRVLKEAGLLAAWKRQTPPAKARASCSRWPPTSTGTSTSPTSTWPEPSFIFAPSWMVARASFSHRLHHSQRQTLRQRIGHLCRPRQKIPPGQRTTQNQTPANPTPCLNSSPAFSI